MLATRQRSEAAEPTIPITGVAQLPTASSRGRRASGLLRRLAREPFVHFLALGALIFVVGGVVQQRRGAESYRIALDEDLWRTLALRWEKQYGSAPTREQLESLAEHFVKEEVLYREGLALHLDRDDEIIRRRVAQKVQFLLQDLAIPTDPTDQQLREYHAAHPSRYIAPARASFSHVYFSADGQGDAGRRASTALEALRAGVALRAPERGDPFPYQYDYSGLSQADVARVFGESAFSRAVFSAPARTWSGPFQSGYGWHLVYVSDRTAARAEPLPEIKDRVTRDYLDDARERNNAERFEELKRKYTIVRGRPRE